MKFSQEPLLEFFLHYGFALNMKKCFLVLSLSLGLFATHVLAEAVPQQMDIIKGPNLQKARSLVGEGKIAQAREIYRSLVDQGFLSRLERDEYEDLNMQLLLSKYATAGSVFYEVVSGDSLHKIALKHGTTAEMIRRSNGLTSDTIYPGMRLKVQTAPFSVLISRAENMLFLKQGEETLKTYAVATGANYLTPLGEFVIVNKLKDPTWYRSGAIIPPGSDDNSLGTRWMGFDLKGYGIHGTTHPESIGTHASEGCVRMLNTDVEELYFLLTEKTKVTIVE